jgi:hypothetical protein
LEEEEMTVSGGDCYSSTEYVQFSAARNAYENGEFFGFERVDLG